MKELSFITLAKNLHELVIKEAATRQAEAEEEAPAAPMNVHFQVEVKKK